MSSTPIPSPTESAILLQKLLLLSPLNCHHDSNPQQPSPPSPPDTCSSSSSSPCPCPSSPSNSALFRITASLLGSCLQTVLRATPLPFETGHNFITAGSASTLVACWHGSLPGVVKVGELVGVDWRRVREVGEAAASAARAESGEGGETGNDSGLDMKLDWGEDEEYIHEGDTGTESSWQVEGQGDRHGGVGGGDDDIGGYRLPISGQFEVVKDGVLGVGVDVGIGCLSSSHGVSDEVVEEMRTVWRGKGLGA